MARDDRKGMRRNKPDGGVSSEEYFTPPGRLVRNRIQETEKLIENLKSEISHFRDENVSVSRQRDDLLRKVSSDARWVGKSAELEKDQRVLRNEREQLYELVRSLGEENSVIKEREARLEAALLDMQEKNAESQETILFLESQINQLEAMVEMLREHHRFMKED